MTHRRSIHLITLSCFFAIGVCAQSIVTVAGGRNDEGRLATAAALARPLDVALDSAGNVYIADVQNNRVRRIDAASGAMTTFAGNGGLGFSGDGGPAALASIWLPSGIAFDAANNLYIADSGNNRVRRVDAVTRTITTVAGGGPSTANRGDGGLATSAYLSAPTRIAIDSAGNLFITQGDDNRIRRVDAATKVITTIAGTGSLGFSGDNGPATAATLNDPVGIAVAANGDIYFADANNYRIRKIAVATGVITTVAGNGSFGFSGDGSAAGDAKLAAPTDVKFDRAGNLYVTDFLNNRIRKIDAATNVITTIAGSGASSFSGDGGPALSATFNVPSASAIDASGNVYVADNANYRVRRIDAATKIVNTIAGGTVGDDDFATSAQILSPSGVAVDNAGNIYISDSGDRRVRRVDAATHLISTLLIGGSFSSYSGIAVDASNNVYVIDSTGVVSKIDPQKVVTRVVGTGQPGFGGDGGNATAAKLAPSGSTGIAFDAAGNLFIADTFNNRIRRVDVATKIITTIAGNGTDGFSGDNGPATSAMLSSPQGVAVDSAGNVYIADTFNHRIRRVDAATKNIMTIAGDGTFGFNGDGILANGAKLALPNAVFVDAAHNIYIADTANNRIRKIDGTTNIITTIAGNGKEGFSGDGTLATSAAITEPLAVTVDATGKVYIADTSNNRIRVLATIVPHQRAARH